MAKSSKKKTDIAVNEDEVLEDAASEAEDLNEAASGDDDAAKDQELEPTDDQTGLEPEPDEAERDGFEGVTEVDEIDPSIAEAEVAVTAPTERQRSGFVPFLIGGLAAGGIGYGVESYVDSRQGAEIDLGPQVEAQSEMITALQGQVDALPEMLNTDALEAQVADTESVLAARLDTLESTVQDQLAMMEARVDALEKRPSGDGTLSDSAIAAYERELEDLRGEVTSLAQQAEADLAAARAAAEAMEQDALAAARAAEARAAINRISVAVETGQPYAETLTDLEALLGTLPSALTARASEGIASQDALADAFPAAARAALASARAEGQADESGGVGAFLRRQFEVRSTTPREGADPDAVLSRAQAAAEEGRLADALAEIETLPEVARAELTDWTADAQARVDALAALSELTETLKEN